MVIWLFFFFASALARAFAEKVNVPNMGGNRDSFFDAVGYFNFLLH
jgi:hypothetical protein